jgi:sialate O-acetylesterase
MRIAARRMDNIPNGSNLVIRFAWHRNPLHNLYNREKLPAVPFRTDQIDLLKKPQ